MTPAEGPSLIANLLPLILVFGIFYFLIIRPQQKQEKLRQKMLSELAKDDKVLTAGGIIGTVSAVRADDIDLKIAENVKVTLTRSAVTSVLNAKSAEQSPVTPK